VEKLSLKELKEQNATPEDVKKEVVEEVVETTESEDETKKVAGEPEAKEAEELKAEEEPESWMQPEESENSEDGQKGEFVPNHAVAAVRRKLKAKLSDSKDENEVLKARIEALEKGGTQAPAREAGLPPRPKREDFDFDDDAYDTAIDDWNDKKVDLKLATHNKSSQQKVQQDRAEESLSESINGHYDNAAKLVDSGKVTEESYLNADKAVRHAVDKVFGGNGDALTDRLIHTLSITGEGSEKVMYQLGVNPSKLARLSELLRDDPNGLSASVYLGTLQAQITTPQKRRSAAPAPAAKVEGEGGKGGPEGIFHKQYKKAGDDVQARIKAKRAAKAQGVDTSQW
jgi:hypothetical protein